MRPPILAVALAALLAGCAGGGGAQIGSGTNARTPSTTAPDAAAPATTAPGAAPVPSGPGTTAPGSPGTSASPPATSARPPPPPPAASDLAKVDVKLTRIASMNEPVAMAVRAGDPALYVAERRGKVRAIRNGLVDATPVLDISDAISTGPEQGLLGLVFSPDGSKLYVDYTDPNNDIHLVEYAMGGGQADPASRREVLSVKHQFSNDNGGNLAFGPDGDLYIGMGDGGGAGDPADNGQNLGTLLGKILRIDPRPDIGRAYTVPPSNPFVGQSGVQPEIWAYGLRNPWRFSFDRATGDLWIGDWGQNAREEVDFQPAGSRGGQNYGWARLEGTRPYTGGAPANAIAPIYDYARAGGNCSVTGGYVYRGSRIPGLVGAYVFADQCGGQVQALRQVNGQVVDQRAFSATARPLVSFGQDQAGELYALSLDGSVLRIDAA